MTQAIDKLRVKEKTGSPEDNYGRKPPRPWTGRTEEKVVLLASGQKLRPWQVC